MMGLRILFGWVFAAPLLAAMAEPAPGPASFAYVLQADSLAKSKAAAIERLAACGRDWIVLDSRFDADTPWTRADLDAIRRAKPGRKVIAYLSIGEAEDYRPYWRKEWGGDGRSPAKPPVWLGKENPDWKGNFQVKYWNAEWQQLMLAAIDDAMGRGFDGVYLYIVDGFETYEQEGRKYLDDRLNPETKQSYRRDMVDWVKAIAARARAKNPEALVIPQNGSQLLAFPDFVGVISSIGLEDVFTNGNALQPKPHGKEVLENLQNFRTTRKPILVIEYPTKSERQALSKKLATENGMIWLVTDRELETLGQSGE